MEIKHRVIFFYKSFIEWWKRHPYLTALAVGQVLSLLIAGTGLCSQLLASKYEVNVPTSQSTLNYILLLIVYGIIHFRNHSLLEILKTKWFIYFPLAFVDVEANYFVVKAYQYTSITSVMLLDCFTIPCVMLFTFLLLKTKYNWRHFVGVVACLAGLAVLVWSDAISNKDSSAPGISPIFGDILCLVGSLLYAISNTGEEISVKKWSVNEFLAMIGFFGAPISFIQLMILERHEVVSIGLNGPVIGLIIAFALILFAMYSLTPYMMALSGSTLFNLSLLTSDAWAILIGMFMFDKKLHWAYWIALVVIVIGLCIYNIRNDPATTEYDQTQHIVEDNTNTSLNNNDELSLNQDIRYESHHSPKEEQYSNVNGNCSTQSEHPSDGVELDLEYGIGFTESNHQQSGRNNDNPVL